MRNQNDFNLIAPFYDGLSKLVFGNKIKNAQIESLDFIPPDSAILIMGGGTGWILDEISKKFPTGLDITYIDKSSRMVQLSQKRNRGLNTIAFVNDSIENACLASEKYNVILTPFFLDCFSQLSLQPVFKKLDDSLKPGGLWINIDFYLSQKSKYRHKILTKLMYLFFRFFSSIEAGKLPSVTPFFSNYIIYKTNMYFNNFITVQVFKKSM